jgi:hypothetical protein
VDRLVTGPRRLVCGVLPVIATLLAPALAGASSATLLRANCAPVAAAKGRIVFNTRLTSGVWDARIGNPDCSGGQALLPPYEGHRGATDMTADGRLVLLETAYGPSRRDAIAEPGKGYGDDLELLSRDTGRVTRLTTGRMGTIWAKFSPDATKIAWAEMESGSDGWNRMLGVWSLHVATLVGGRLAAEREWQHPTQPGFIEPYGWLPGTNRVVFASDSGTRDPFMWWLGAQLWTIPDDLPAGESRARVSPPFRTPTWCAAYTWCSQPYTDANAYHEFAHFNGDGWLYTSVLRDALGGMDLWRMRYDGSGRERVSWFGGRPDASGAATQVPGWPAPRYVVVGSMAWVGGAWVAAVAGDANAQTIDAYRIVP